jgi:hypothetical protein
MVDARAVLALPCGSRSMTRTRAPAWASAATLTVVVSANAALLVGDGEHSGRRRPWEVRPLVDPLAGILGNRLGEGDHRLLGERRKARPDHREMFHVKHRSLPSVAPPWGLVVFHVKHSQ